MYFPEAGTDGDTYPNSGAGDSGEFAVVWSGSQYVQLDLGALYSVDKIKVWHYFVDGRTYHGVKLQVSANGSIWTTIYDSAVQGEYAETSAGKTHTFTAQSVRYVREYLNGSTANAEDHWVEMEVFGSRTNVMIGDYFEWNENSGVMVKYSAMGTWEIDSMEEKVFQQLNPIWREKANFIIGARVDDSSNDVWEQIWSRKVENALYEICCIPFFIYNVALGDEVEIVSDHWIRAVKKRSGHFTFRVWIGDSKDPTIREQVMQETEKLDCLFEWYSENLLAVL